MKARKNKFWNLIKATNLITVCLTVIISTTAALAERQVVMENLVFINFHDPGWMTLEGPDDVVLEPNFYYKLIPYEVVGEWRPGEKFNIVFDDDPAIGLGILRQDTDQFYKVVFDYKDHPLLRLEKECVRDREGTMIAVTTCAAKVADNWRSEQYSLISYLRGLSSARQMEAIDESQVEWEKYADRRDAIYGDFSREYFLGTMYGYYHGKMNANSEYARYRDLVTLLGAYPEN